MKKIALFLALSIITLASCTKQKSTPSNNTGSAVTPRTVNIEYRITDASGDVTVDYIAPDQNGDLVTTVANITKTYKSISFSAQSQHTYSINAKNSNMSLMDITVDIYVDGQLFKSGSMNHTTLTASASGLVQ